MNIDLGEKYRKMNEIEDSSSSSDSTSSLETAELDQMTELNEITDSNDVTVTEIDASENDQTCCCELM